MKKNRIWLYLVLAAAGIASFCIGGFVLVGEDVKTASGWCIGLGAAAFSLGVGNFINALIVSKAESGGETERKKRIEVSDERNVRIREKVGAKISRVDNYALCAVVLVLSLMRADMAAVFIVLAVILLNFVLAVVFSNYYSKRM